MDLKPYIAPLLKWWWLIVLAALLALGTSFLAVRNQPPVYNARTTLLIGRTIFDPNPSSNEIFLNQQLGNLYSDIATREPVQTATMKALGLTWLPKYVVRPLSNSQFIEIVVTDVDPERAYKVAAELANQLVNLSPAGAQSEDQTRQAFTHDQLNQMQADITQTQKDIADKQAALGQLTSAREIADAQSQIQALETKLSLLQTNYANLLQSSNTGATNILQVIEPASLPTRPVGPNKYIIVAIAGLIGMILGAGTAYLLEFLDDTIKTPEDLTHILDLPVLGYLADQGRQFEERPYVTEYPRSRLAEAYRSLRANLEFAKSGPEMKVILITSPDAGDGKTSVAVNLAATLIHAGKDVLLVDADFRKPNVHKFLGLDNKIGLGEVLTGEIDLGLVVQKWKDQRLRMIPAGQSAERIDEMLQVERIGEIFEELRMMADVILVDSSPFLVSDVMALLPHVDGALVVIRPGSTHRKMVELMIERIERAGGILIGAVLNRIPLRQAGYIAEYRHYAPYEYSPYADHNGFHTEKKGSNGAAVETKEKVIQEVRQTKVVGRRKKPTG